MSTAELSNCEYKSDFPTTYSEGRFLLSGFVSHSEYPDLYFEDTSGPIFERTIHYPRSVLATTSAVQCSPPPPLSHRYPRSCS